jgi:hypothetical protein
MVPMRPMILVAVALCAGLMTHIANSQRANYSAPVVAFLFDPFDPPIGRSLVLGDAEERVRDRFGEPHSIDRTTGTDDRDPTATVERVVSRYPGLVVETVRNLNFGGSWIRQVELTDQQYALKFGLGVGASRSALASALSVEIPARREYVVSSRYSEVRSDHLDPLGRPVGVGTGDMLTVVFDDADRVVKLIWKYYAD